MNLFALSILILHLVRLSLHEVNGFTERSFKPYQPPSWHLPITSMTSRRASIKSTFLSLFKQSSSNHNEVKPLKNVFASRICCLLLVAATAASPVLADEIGRERDAPTIYTGETVEICVKRGPLGACLKTEVRTDSNDNDIAQKYFRENPLPQQQRLRVEQEQSVTGNALVERLRQQSIANQEKNELYVARKTFEADQSATFGPFDRQVLIMNTDGKTFTLLKNPVAMRLKKEGFIDGKRSFVKQPTVEQLEQAENASNGGFLEGLFGGGNK